MLAQSPLLRRAARWVLVGVFFVGFAAVADMLGDALSAIAASIVFGI